MGGRRHTFIRQVLGVTDRERVVSYRFVSARLDKDSKKGCEEEREKLPQGKEGLGEGASSREG